MNGFEEFKKRMQKGKDAKDWEAKSRKDQSVAASTFAVDQQKSSALLGRLADLTNSNTELIKFGVQYLTNAAVKTAEKTSKPALHKKIAEQLDVKRAEKTQALLDNLKKQLKTIVVLDARTVITILKKAKGDAMILKTLAAEIIRMTYSVNPPVAFSLLEDYPDEKFSVKINTEDRFKAMLYHAPNSIANIARMNTDSKSYSLFPFQTQLLDLAYNGKNVLGCSPTTTGKTIAIMMLVSALAKTSNITTVYLAPNELLVLQTAAALKDVNNQVRMAVYTERLTIPSVNPHIILSTPAELVKLHAHTWTKRSGAQIPLLAILDEFHYIESQEYYDAVRLLARMTKSVVALSATLGNLSETQQFLELLFRLPVTLVEMPSRAVRLNYYHGTTRMHPWIGAKSLVSGLSPYDLYDAYQLMGKKLEVNERVTLNLCDKLEEVIKCEFKSPDCKSNKLSVSLDQLDSVLSLHVQDGTVLVFAQNPREIAEQFVQMQCDKLLKKYPWWYKLQVLNAEYVTRLANSKRSTVNEDGDVEEINDDVKILGERSIALAKLLPKEIADREKSRNPSVIQDIPDEFMFACGNPPKMSEINSCSASVASCVKFGFSYLSGTDDLDHTFKTLKWLQYQNIGILFVDDSFSVGLNLPVRTVVIYDPKTKYSGVQLTQMGGRAGRKGIDAFGSVIFMTPDMPVLSGANNLKLPAIEIPKLNLPKPIPKPVKPVKPVTPKPKIPQPKLVYKKPIPQKPSDDAW